MRKRGSLAINDTSAMATSEGYIDSRVDLENLVRGILNDNDPTWNTREECMEWRKAYDTKHVRLFILIEQIDEEENHE